jgi:hypothetical protein
LKSDTLTVLGNLNQTQGTATFNQIFLNGDMTYVNSADETVTLESEIDTLKSKTLYLGTTSVDPFGSSANPGAYVANGNSFAVIGSGSTANAFEVLVDSDPASEPIINMRGPINAFRTLYLLGGDGLVAGANISQLTGSTSSLQSTTVTNLTSAGNITQNSGTAALKTVTCTGLTSSGTVTVNGTTTCSTNITQNSGTASLKVVNCTSLTSTGAVTCPALTLAGTSVYPMVSSAVVDIAGSTTAYVGFNTVPTTATHVEFVITNAKCTSTASIFFFIRLITTGDAESFTYAGSARTFTGSALGGANWSGTGTLLCNTAQSQPVINGIVRLTKVDTRWNMEGSVNFSTGHFTTFTGTAENAGPLTGIRLVHDTTATTGWTQGGIRMYYS